MRITSSGKFWLGYAAFVVLICFAAFFTAFAGAQTQPATCTAGGANTACLQWTKPTLDTAGNALTQPVTINVYYGIGTAAKTQIFSGVTGTSALHSPLAPANHCYEVTAVHSGLESARSPAVCKSITFQAPQAPTGLAVK